MTSKISASRATSRKANADAATSKCFSKMLPTRTNSPAITFSSAGPPCAWRTWNTGSSAAGSVNSSTMPVATSIHRSSYVGLRGSKDQQTKRDRQARDPAIGHHAFENETLALGLARNLPGGNVAQP